MSVMAESLSDVVGIMSVSSDEEAILMMNDSDFGLTASIWTKMRPALEIANQLDTGTVFMNRCDYLDPQLAWVGVKNSVECTLQNGLRAPHPSKSFPFEKYKSIQQRLF